MPALGLHSAWLQDLPVCFPARPCVDYSPFEADAINITSGLTPASQAIAVGCFAVLGVALVLVLLGLRPHPRRSGPGLWVVALSTALLLVGVIVATVVDLRLTAISAIYGLEPPGGPVGLVLFGSWSLVGLAGEAMAAAGTAGLVTTATVAIVRLRRIVPSGGRAPAA